MPTTRAPGRSPAGTHDELDVLTTRTALWSLAVAGVAVALPALVEAEAATYSLVQGGSLLTMTAVLAGLRRRLSATVVARTALAAAAAVVLVSAVVSGGAASVVYHAYSVALVGAAWLVFAPRAATIATAVVIAAGGLLAVVTSRQWLPDAWLHGSPLTMWITTSAASVLVALVQWLEVHRLRASGMALQAQLQRSEDALRKVAESEQRYADVVSMAPGVVYQFEVRPDRSRAMTFISDSARHLFDVAPETILADAGVLFRMIDPPSQLAEVEASIARSRDTLTPWELQGTIRTPAGHTKWIRGHSTPTRLEDGTVRWHGVFTDVTERTRSEMALGESRTALKQSLSMMQGAFESTADGLLVVDTTGRVTGFNQKFLALWRVPTVIASTRDDAQLLAHVLSQLEDPDAFLARVRELYGQLDAVSFDTVAFRDGRRYERYSQPQVVDGVVVGRVWSFRDVTTRIDEERKRGELEQQLQQAQTLEALGTLAGGIAHDFNNLITIVLTNAEQAAAATTDEARRASLAAVTRAGHRAGALVREIGEFSEPRPVERGVVAAAEAIGPAIHLLRTTVPKSIEIVERLDPSVTMFANAMQVQQVVTNLLISAAHAIGERAGRVTVTLDEVGAADVPPATPRPLAERYARLVVRDTGWGNRAEAMPRVFDPFYATRPAAASGLGLAVVQGIVRRYHGDLDVHSVPGDGTTFRVFWPALPPAAAQATTSPLPPGALRSAATRHILVVDDEADIVRVVSEGLRRIGYVVTSATDPREALAAFTRDPAAIDAVLTDLSMPHITGVDLGRRVLDLRPETPVVLFTGYAAELSADEAHSIGFRAVLHKPMTLAVLAEALHRALDGPPRDRTGTGDAR